MATGGKLSDLTDPKAVRLALAEYRSSGQDAFLDKYGFRRSRDYLLVEDGVGYDSKAVAAAAYGYQHGTPLEYDDFSGGAPVIRTLSTLGFKVARWTSQQLVETRAYTRKELIEKFSITDSTVNTGVFRPRDTNSIWLFITRDKSSDRTPYVNIFEGDLLRMQGQTAGRTDDQIVKHEANADELLVFYRESKNAHPGAGFRYEGQFRYLKHVPGKPSSFVLQRSSSRHDSEFPTDDFDPQSIIDGRKKIQVMVHRRQGQPAFRRALLRAYAGQCAVTGCSVEPLLEAAHIHPYRGDETNKVQNGLLLRADIHTLFDLGLITVDAQGKVTVASRLKGTEYWTFQGALLRKPANAPDWPSQLALTYHRDTNAKAFMADGT